MAENGFKLLDAEMHVMEPVDLWQRYIDREFADRAPRRLNERRWDIRTIVEGEVMAAMPGGDWPALTDAEEKALAERYTEEIACNFDPASQVRAAGNPDDAVLLAERVERFDGLFSEEDNSCGWNHQTPGDSQVA